MDIYTLYYIDLRSVDNEELFNSLHKMGFQESYLSEISFCPYLLIHKDYETNTYPTYENINEGYIRRIKSKCILYEDTDIESFINHAYTLTDKVNNSGLF